MPPGSSINGLRGARFSRAALATPAEIARLHQLAAEARPNQPVTDLGHCVVFNYVNNEFCNKDDVCEKDVRTGRFRGKSLYFYCHCSLIRLLEKHGPRVGQHLLIFIHSHGGMIGGETYCISSKEHSYGRTPVTAIVDALKKVTSGCTVVMLCCRTPNDPAQIVSESASRGSANSNVIWVCRHGQRYKAGHPVDAYKEEVLKAYEETTTVQAALRRILKKDRKDALEFHVDHATNGPS